MRLARFVTLDRLTLRLAVGITVLVIVPLVAGLYVLSRYHYSRTIEARRGAAELENRILEVALRHQMIEKDGRLMTEVLAEIARQPEVRSAMVLDHEGEVRLSGNPDDVGVRISRGSPTCLVCHSKTPESRERWVLLEEQDANVLRTVRPIENRPECHGCHDPQKKLNGILILDLSLTQVEAQLRFDQARMLIVTGILTIVILAGTGLLVRYLVLRRLSRLGRTARSIAGGALEERASVAGDDVIASLASDFNSMADAASDLIGEVKEREQQVAGVLNSLDDGLIVLDRDFRVIAANRSISKRLCAYPEALQGRNCRDAIGHSLPCHEDNTCPAARCLSTGRLERAVYNLPAADGAEGRVHEVYASPVYSKAGDVVQVVEVWRDITERVREEERLAEIERLSALGILASGLSHEINTPLASTLTSAESILGRLDTDDGDHADPARLEAVRESADVIRQQVLRCRKITDQFLRFARGIPPSVETLDLLEVVRGVFQLAAPTARQSEIEVDLRPCEGLPLVSANTEVVQHVVLNVLVNAIESFDGNGGKITAGFDIGDDIRLWIRDTGCGIRPDVQRRLFEPFQTQKPRGTGLGLFLSRTFIRRFGGDVRLRDSVVGKGSCVEIIFARADGGVE